LRTEFDLHFYWSGYTDPPQLQTDILACRKSPALRDLHVFHGNGRVREAAVDALAAPLQAPMVYALFSRLNDWAGPVREAARRAVDRSMPDTPADAIAPAMRVLLPRATTWRRWTRSDQDMLDAVLMRADVAEALMDHVVTTRDAGLGPLFRALYPNPAIDAKLDWAFQEARQPHIRAMALDALLMRQLRWPTREMQKVPGQWRYQLEPIWADRAVTVEVDLAAALERGVADGASIVRKAAADGLIRYRNDPRLSGRVEPLTARLEADKNVAVRGRMEFLHRKLAEEAGSPS
jgi:hypothetical protein